MTFLPRKPQDDVLIELNKEKSYFFKL